MPTDDVEEREFNDDELDNDSDDEIEFITTIATSDEWTTFRNSLAQNLFNGWRARVRQGLYFVLVSILFLASFFELC